MNTQILVGVLGLIATGCHDVCAPDDTPATQQHAGTIEVTGEVAGEAEGADVVMPSAVMLTHCVPTNADAFCFTVGLPRAIEVGERYDLAQTSATASLPRTDTVPSELGVLSGTLTVNDYETHWEDGGGGEGDRDLIHTRLRATLDAVARFAAADVSIELELDYEDQAQLACYAHLM